MQPELMAVRRALAAPSWGNCCINSGLNWCASDCGAEEYVRRAVPGDPAKAAL